VYLHNEIGNKNHGETSTDGSGSFGGHRNIERDPLYLIRERGQAQRARECRRASSAAKNEEGCRQDIKDAT
jgi:hypothetical protein